MAPILYIDYHKILYINCLTLSCHYQNLLVFINLIPQLATIIPLLMYVELGTMLPHAIFSLGRNNIREH